MHTDMRMYVHTYIVHTNCFLNFTLIFIGASCRTKVTATLAKQYASPAVAEQHFMKLFSPCVPSSTMLTPVASSVSSAAQPNESDVTSQATTCTSLLPTPVLLSSLLNSDQVLSASSNSKSLGVLQQHPSPLLKDITSVQAYCNNALINLTVEEQFKTLSRLFSSLLQKNSTCLVPDDFLELAANGMIRFQLDTPKLV